MLASEVAGTLFDSTAFTESLPLLKGTMLSEMPVASLIISATKCGVLPVPAVAQLTPLSPCAFAQATNDAMLLAGMLGCTTMIDGATAIMPTGTSSGEDFHEQAVCLEGRETSSRGAGWR